MLPGGYLTFTVMTRLPGNTAYNLRYWDLNAEEREEIKEGFLPALRYGNFLPFCILGFVKGSLA